jgi:hypothetical protein
MACRITQCPIKDDLIAHNGQLAWSLQVPHPDLMVELRDDHIYWQHEDGFDHLHD